MRMRPPIRKLNNQARTVTAPRLLVPRLVKLRRVLGAQLPSTVVCDFFVSRWGSLGDKTPLQAVRTGRGFRHALRKAKHTVEEYRR